MRKRRRKKRRKRNRRRKRRNSENSVTDLFIINLYLISDTLAAVFCLVTFGLNQGCEGGGERG